MALRRASRLGPVERLTARAFPPPPTLDNRYGWRQQIQPWAQRGFRIIAPSALGYGGTVRRPASSSHVRRSTLTPELPLAGCGRLFLLDGLSQDKPTDPAEYTWRKLADDLDALLDVAVGKDERVFVVSHDWGAFTGWRYLQWHGARVKAFCSCVPRRSPALSPSSPALPDHPGEAPRLQRS